MSKLTSPTIGTASIHPETIAPLFFVIFQLEHNEVFLSMGEPALVSIGAVAFFFESSAKFCFVFVSVGLAAITVTGGGAGRVCG